MPTSVGPNTFGEENLVFGYDLGDTVNSYRGEPTVNYITTMAANLGGNVSLSYPNNVYICTAQETNVIDPNAPGGQYSRFTGNTDSDNNQLFTSFVDGSVNARNTTVAYSVYLKGTGTCHLTVYSDIAGYSTTPTINLTGEWTRYSIVQAVGNYTTHAWSAVRGILTSTNVYVAAQQVEFKSHVTPFINGTRSATQGLIDLTGTSTIDLTNVSFDSDAQMIFDGTSDYVDLGSDVVISPNNQGWTAEYIFNTNSASTLQHFNSAEADDFNANWLAILSSKLAVWDHGQGTWRYGNTQFSSNTWYYVAFVQVSSTTMQFYVNGEAEGGDHVSFSWSPTYSALKTRYIGRYEYNGGYGRYFNGEIPLTKLYNRALTAQEVRANYNAIKGRFNI
jgi:hypothetical protein